MVTSMTTDRLILRDYNDIDINDYFRLKSDKETMYYLQDIQLFSKEEANADFANVLTMFITAKEYKELKRKIGSLFFSGLIYINEILEEKNTDILR